MTQAKIGDVNIEYYVEGEGPPLLMIMGFGGQASSWGEPMLGALRPHFQLIRLSNRGTGDSDRWQVPASIKAMADDAAGLLSELGIEKAHVFGVSMGGMISQELVLNHPQRVNGLVLGCTTPGGPRSVPPATEIVGQMVPTPGLSREEQIRKMWPAVCAPDFLQSGSEFLEQMLQSSLKKPTPMETIMQQMTAIQAFDAYDRLPQINAPTLVIHGDVDRLIPPENGRIIHERIAGSRLEILPGTAHMFFWEQPEEAGSAIVEFLSSVLVKV